MTHSCVSHDSSYNLRTLQILHAARGFPQKFTKVSSMQHPATPYNIPHSTTTCALLRSWVRRENSCRSPCNLTDSGFWEQCAKVSSLQHTAIPCITLQHATTRYQILPHDSGNNSQKIRSLHNTATPCNTLWHTSTPCNMILGIICQSQLSATPCNSLKHNTTHYNILQHDSLNNSQSQLTATPCNTLLYTIPH